MLMVLSTLFALWCLASYFILDTLNLALYLLKALALLNPGTCMWAFCFGFSCLGTDLSTLLLGIGTSKKAEKRKSEERLSCSAPFIERVGGWKYPQSLWRLGDIKREPRLAYLSTFCPKQKKYLNRLFWKGNPPVSRLEKIQSTCWLLSSWCLL